MLLELLKQAEPSQVLWWDGMDGVQVCRFALKRENGQESFFVPAVLEDLHFETLFCRKGRLLLESADRSAVAVEPGAILLLSDVRAVQRAVIEESLEGILVAVDARTARGGLQALLELLGEPGLDVDAVRNRMARCGGCALVERSYWAQAVFQEMERLSRLQQGRYCAWKSVELLYLLCHSGQAFPLIAPSALTNQRMEERVRQMHSYMERHLQEKLTIPMICGKFYLSPTSFKKYFRCIYGQPVHRWLQARRMERAAELLRTSNKTVLQIAHSVGYEGLSQFNAAFKRRFDQTPRQYRNGSKTAGAEADTVGQDGGQAL